MHGTTLLTSAVCALLGAHGAAAHAGVFSGEAFQVTELHSGNFSVASVDMRATQATQATIAAGGWRADETVRVTVKGTTAKRIVAGTFKYQVYETGTKSFIASGNSPYFKCDNKGCDTSAPIALRWDKGQEETAGRGAFTLDMNLALPKMTSASKEFRLVLWGEDQDHFPYDFTATLTFDYTAESSKELLDVGDEPASCIAEAKKLCGSCDGKGKPCWVKCAMQHKAALRAAGCTKPGADATETAPVNAGGEPASCIAEAKKLCGSCDGKGKPCWVKCAMQHKAALRAAGCTKPGADATETALVTSSFDADSHIGRAGDYEDQHRFGPGGEKRGFGPGGGIERLFGPGATEPVQPDVPPVASSNLMSFLFGASEETFQPCGTDKRCSASSRHCRNNIAPTPNGCCKTDAVPVYNAPIMTCCPEDTPIAWQDPNNFNRWACKASNFRR
jgi:hypothetical protein